MTAFVNLVSLAKIPLLAFTTPEFAEFSDERVVVKMRLDYRTKNHLNVMYFGALSMGAELSVAATCVDAIHKSGQRIDFLFKEFDAQFLKRADGHVLFVCDQAASVRELVEKACGSSERLEKEFEGYAYVQGKNEPVMKYKVTLTMKNRSFAKT